MTIEQMRALLGLAPEISNEDVILAYAAYLAALPPEEPAGDAALVTKEDIKARTRIDDEASDDDLNQIALEATDIIVKYIKRPDHGWTKDTVPPRIVTCILLTASALYDGSELLSGQVRMMLEGERDPAIA